MTHRLSFLLTPLREGRQNPCIRWPRTRNYFYSRPCGRGDHCLHCHCHRGWYFYSRPCGRGDMGELANAYKYLRISTHAPAGGATFPEQEKFCPHCISTHAPAGGATISRRTPLSRSPVFLLTPLREGRRTRCGRRSGGFPYFYSRPCGRGDRYRRYAGTADEDFYSRPCGRGDSAFPAKLFKRFLFLLTPLREGRLQFSTSPS